MKPYWWWSQCNGFLKARFCFTKIAFSQFAWRKRILCLHILKFRLSISSLTFSVSPSFVFSICRYHCLSISRSISFYGSLVFIHRSRPISNSQSRRHPVSPISSFGVSISPLLQFSVVHAPTSVVKSFAIQHVSVDHSSFNIICLAARI